MAPPPGLHLLMSDFTGDPQSTADLFSYWTEKRHSRRTQFKNIMRILKNPARFESADKLQDYQAIEYQFRRFFKNWNVEIVESYSNTVRTRISADYLTQLIKMADSHLFRLKTVLKDHANFQEAYDRVDFQEFLDRTSAELVEEFESVTGRPL